jgi:hypothetical protein
MQVHNFNFQTSPNNPNVQYLFLSYLYNIVAGGQVRRTEILRKLLAKGRRFTTKLKNFEYTRYNNPYLWLMNGIIKMTIQGQVV